MSRKSFFSVYQTKIQEKQEFQKWTNINSTSLFEFREFIYNGGVILDLSHFKPMFLKIVKFVNKPIFCLSKKIVLCNHFFFFLLKHGPKRFSKQIQIE